ncbi:hypothetical protein QQF64_021387 [Cirrhinus molitorella]|uniref:G-protein coupled receptors family 1 profile domain-containing protein n=1 Tax=Cirrhinus molitorella TaxID=172907 RepID=A0ABR3LBV4_9TELE
MNMLEMTNISYGTSVFSVNKTIFDVLHSSFITTAFGINMVLGLPANFYILWLSVKEMIQGQSIKIFNVNGAFAEIIFCFAVCFVIPEYFFNCIECRLPVVFLGQFLLLSRPLFLSCICVECYVGVLHPLIFLKLKPMKYRIALSATGWIFIISSCAIGTTGVIRYYNLLLPELLFFFFVKLYSCLMVLKALLRPGPGDDVKKRSGANWDKIKAFQIILILLVFSTLTYGPIFVSLVLYYILDFEKFLLSWSISLTFGIMLGILYPIVHLKTAGKLLFC